MDFSCDHKLRKPSWLRPTCSSAADGAPSLCFAPPTSRQLAGRGVAMLPTFLMKIWGSERLQTWTKSHSPEWQDQDSSCSCPFRAPVFHSIQCLLTNGEIGEAVLVLMAPWACVRTGGGGAGQASSERPYAGPQAVSLPHSPALGCSRAQRHPQLGLTLWDEDSVCSLLPVLPLLQQLVPGKDWQHWAGIPALSCHPFCPKPEPCSTICHRVLETVPQWGGLLSSHFL